MLKEVLYKVNSLTNSEERPNDCFFPCDYLKYMFPSIKEAVTVYISLLPQRIDKL